MAKQKAVLDANVLYDGFLRDLLLSIFAAKMYEAKWTEKITEEWVGHLLENRSTVSEEKIRRTVFKMNAILPSPLVANYEQYIDQVTIPDKDDRHVVAAAMACGAQKIVTWNLADFPNNILKVFGIVAESPDKFIFDILIESPLAVVTIFKEIRERFKAPPLSVSDFFERLNKSRLAMTARHLEHYRELL